MKFILNSIACKLKIIFSAIETKSLPKTSLARWIRYQSLLKMQLKSSIGFLIVLLLTEIGAKPSAFIRRRRQDELPMTAMRVVQVETEFMEHVVAIGYAFKSGLGEYQLKFIRSEKSKREHFQIHRPALHRRPVKSQVVFVDNQQQSFARRGKRQTIEFSNENNRSSASALQFLSLTLVFVFPVSILIWFL